MLAKLIPSLVWLITYSTIRFTEVFAIHRNFSLLSFGDEAEEDEEQIAVVSKVHAPDFKCLSAVVW